MNTTIQTLLHKHSTWGSLLDSPDYDELIFEPAMHDYQDYYAVKQLKEELGGNEDILIAVRKLKEENEQLKKDYVKLHNNSTTTMIECINCEELVKDDQICPRMYEAQKVNWCMDCSAGWLSPMMKN